MSLHNFSLFYPTFGVSPEVPMRIIDNLAEMTETARGWLFGGTVGCVLVMGDVHAGYDALIQVARACSEICVVCVLPDGRSLLPARCSTYGPYDSGNDLESLKSSGADVVFLPHREDLFPADFSTYVAPTVPWLGEQQNAQGRDFATVMLKLCNLIHPDIFYFGQRDARYIALLKQLVRDFNLDVEVGILPTAREENGLAIANHHALLSGEGFSGENYSAACLLYEALLLGKSLIERGERCPHVVEEAMRLHLATDASILLQEMSICHADTLCALQEIVPNTLLEIRIRLGSISLTDNIVWLRDGHWLL
ncbi:MAG TPA: pantoate--beta-alanine ligase [Ktedonobacteraceae bacterium]